MDCDKFDSLLIDELYNELDEITSAAMRRHASGCPRCTSIWSGLRATKELAVLPEPPVPEGFEERILSAVRDAQKSVPLPRGRFARAISWAGSWAMRPQTAMAALFLLMIGSSALLLRSRQPRESAALTVTEQGSPSPRMAAAEERDSFDTRTAASAHGAYGAQASPPAEAPVAAATATPENKAKGAPMAQTPGGGATALDENRSGLGTPAQRELGRKDISNAGPAAGAPAPLAPPFPAPARPEDQLARDDGKGDSYTSGMAAYQAQRFGDAARLFDAAAGAGNVGASLWAARSIREGSGCPAAVARFNSVAAQAAGTPVGYDATYEAARCYEQMGDREAARSRYAALLGVPAFAGRAQTGLNGLSEMASRRAAESPGQAAAERGAGSGGGGKTAAPRPAAPATKPVQQQKSASDVSY